MISRILLSCTLPKSGCTYHYRIYYLKPHFRHPNDKFIGYTTLRTSRSPFQPSPKESITIGSHGAYAPTKHTTWTKTTVSFKKSWYGIHTSHSRSTTSTTTFTTCTTSSNDPRSCQNHLTSDSTPCPWTTSYNDSFTSHTKNTTSKPTTTTLKSCIDDPNISHHNAENQTSWMSCSGTGVDNSILLIETASANQYISIYGKGARTRRMFRGTFVATQASIKR